MKKNLVKIINVLLAVILVFIFTVSVIDNARCYAVIASPVVFIIERFVNINFRAVTA